jgi:hypothetical protein
MALWLYSGSIARQSAVCFGRGCRNNALTGGHPAGSGNVDLRLCRSRAGVCDVGAAVAAAGDGLVWSPLHDPRGGLRRRTAARCCLLRAGAGRHEAALGPYLPWCCSDWAGGATAEGRACVS